MIVIIRMILNILKRLSLFGIIANCFPKIIKKLMKIKENFKIYYTQE